jgi:hypothetical protein
MSETSAKSIAFLRRVYSEIFSGYTPFIDPISGNRAFIRHVSSSEQSELDARYEEILEDIVSKGVPNEASALAIAKERGFWKDSTDKELEIKREELRQLRDTKKCLILPSQICSIDKSIADAESYIRGVEIEREEALGVTAESLAMARLNNVYIQLMMFCDKKLEVPLFPPERFDTLQYREVTNVTAAYNAAMSKFANVNIKNLSVAAFVQNMFNLAGKKPYSFFGKAIGGLTFYQIELMNYVAYFSALLSSENRPPDSIMDDPEKIVNWYTAEKNSREALKSGNGSVSIAGATQEDLQQLGVANKVVDLAAIAKKKGSTGLTMDELMSISRGASS